MNIFITAIRLEPSDSNQHEHIAWVKWMESGGTTETISSRQQMVDWINAGGKAWVSDGQTVVQVGVVKADPPYLRTFADGTYTNNLLSLPRF